MQKVIRLLRRAVFSRKITFDVTCRAILTVVFSLFLLNGQAQDNLERKKVTLELKNVSLKEAFLHLQKQSGVNFVFSSEFDVYAARKVSISRQGVTIKAAIESLLKDLRLRYTLVGDQVVIDGMPLASQPQPGNTTERRDSRQVTVRGRVFDSKEPPGPLIGVTVKIRDKTIATVTDNTGNFEIQAAEGDLLVFSSIGFKVFEYPVRTAGDNIIISLQEDVGVLESVVVTGYSEQKLKHLATSLSTVDMRSIEGKPITQLSQALQGGVTGLTVTQSSGLPGGDAATIKIRGISTLGNTDPLVLVDGVPFNINDVDPTTVESISILKDAAAAAIYGARAANGVIVITTKRGKAGRVNITYDAYAGQQRPSYLPEFVDAPRYMEMVNEALINNGGAARYSPEDIEKTRAGTDPLNYPDTDWKSLVLNNRALVQNHTIGVTGGNNIARFAVNAGYLDQQGIIRNTSFNRFSLRANTSVTLKENLSMHLDLSLIRKDSKYPVERYNRSIGGAGYIFYDLYRIPPNIMAKYPLREDGYQAYGQYAEMLNPVAELEKAGYTRSKEDNININFQPQWSITPSLKLKGQYLFRTVSTANVRNSDAYVFLDYFTNALQFTYPSEKTTSIYKQNYQYLSALLDYNQSMGKHTVYALAGISREIDNPDRSNQFVEANLASFFVKANYIFDNRYLLETGWRLDGSSRFGPGHKWGQFPSVAVGWNVHNENFLNTVKWLDNFKLRASYGLLGNNQNIGLYQYQDQVNASNGTEAVRGNPDITWEAVSMLDIGTDIRMFGSRLGITVDWYDKTTDDILLRVPLSLSSGIVDAPVNAGKVRNRGWEFAINYSHQFTSDFRAVLSTGFSQYQNKVLSLRGGPYRDGTTIHKEGYSLGSYYGYRTAGLLQAADIDAGIPMIGSNTATGPIQQAGDIRYLDLNGDGTITSDDQEIIGNPNPRGNYFANLRFEHHRFDLEMQVNGFTKSDAYYTRRHQAPLNLVGDGGGTPMTWQTDYWTPANTDARFPRLTPDPGNNILPSDYWRVNAAFARVRFIQLGYNLSPNWSGKIGATSVRLYLNTQNPFTISTMKQLDPETRGAEYTYPLMRFYTIGINIRF